MGAATLISLVLTLLQSILASARVGGLAPDVIRISKRLSQTCWLCRARQSRSRRWKGCGSRQNGEWKSRVRPSGAEALDQTKWLTAAVNYCATQSSHSFLSDFFTPVFQRLLDDDHELVSYGAVDDAVVVAESEMDDRTDGDGVSAVLIGHDERLFSDTAYSHNRDVGLVDDGKAEDGTELSGVCDGEGRTFHVGGHEFLGSGALAQVGDAAL